MDLRLKDSISMMGELGMQAKAAEIFSPPTLPPSGIELSES